MGNSDGLASAILSEGQNRLIYINKKDYFSFARGDEIALVIDDKYYILNCSDDLWKMVKQKVNETKDIKVIKKWWIKLSKLYEISDWSNNF